MAAFDTPLVDQLLTPPRQQRHQRPSPSSSTTASPAMPEAKSTILAQFPPGREPAGTSHIIPDSITNLLDSTPPQIVRALGQAEPLVRGLNTVLAILTWTSGQDWLSFLLLVAWWTICLYGYVIIKFAGNFVPVIIIATLYSLHRTAEPTPERTSTHTSLSATLKDIDLLRARINLFLTPPSLLIPYLRLPESQPLLLRLCFAWPIWLLITHKILPPNKIMLVLGTSVLCWSAPWARVICIALWRSRTVRQLCGYITGQDLLNYSPPVEPVATAQSTLAAEPERRDRHEKRVSNNLITDVLGGGIKVTQTIYQSQRRWIGIGWTSNLFPNERSPWADETGHSCPSLDEFKLPPEKSSPYTLPTGEKALRVARWKWIDPEWKPVTKPNQTDTDGWVYTDNTWKNPGPGEAFGKYTRRRKFTRTSELTEEIIPLEDDAAVPRIESVTPRVGSVTPRVGSVTPRIGSASPSIGSVNPRTTSISTQPSPSVMTTSPTPNLPPRNQSPVALRPGGDDPGRLNLEKEIREAVGDVFGIDGAEESSKEKGKSRSNV